MTRREIIKRTALLTGYALSASVIQGVLQGCQAEGKPDWQPLFFSPEQGRQVADMAETILPKTDDSPGAKDVNVHEFMDLVIKDCFKAKEQEKFIEGLTALNEQANASYGQAFSSLSLDQQLELLQQVDKEARIEAQKGQSKPFFLDFKQLAIASYFTSEQVGKEVLAYDPIPGEFEPCIPLEEVGKVWAI